MITIALVLFCVVNGCLMNGVEKAETIICEGHTESISCKEGQIKIKHVSYGRHDGTTCPHPKIKTTDCHASNSLSIVSGLCNGKSSCSLKASNSVFGDPCVNTYKYLSVVYTCKTKETIICEGHAESISCKKGQIKIKYASYGRHDGTTCPHPKIKTTDCHASNSLSVVSGLCNGKSSCSLKASNSAFGDPCVNTYKYLSVVFMCKTKETIICEGHAESISCKEGQIKIKYASYGRHDGSTCPHPKIKTTDCHSSNSLSIVSGFCNGKSSCSLKASNSVFGDPCVNTVYKYLSVVFTCKTKETIICEGHAESISCKKGQIKINYASYGRHDGTTCPHPKIKTTDCHASNSLPLVSVLCNGKSSCSLKASNSVFGDPCVNTYKYISVVFTCKTKGRSSST